MSTYKTIERYKDILNKIEEEIREKAKSISKSRRVLPSAFLLLRSCLGCRQSAAEYLLFSLEHSDKSDKKRYPADEEQSRVYRVFVVVCCVAYTREDCAEEYHQQAVKHGLAG